MKVLGAIGAVFAGLFGLVLVIFLGLAIRFGSLHVERWFQPQEENVRREVFEQTKSYNESREQQLVKYRYEYMTGDESDKTAIEATVRTMFADYDESYLEPELRKFLNQCRYPKKELFNVE